MSEDEDTNDEEKFDQSVKGGESLRNNTHKPKEDVVLPEWLLELPEDLEVGRVYLTSILMVDQISNLMLGCTPAQ